MTNLNKITVKMMPVAALQMACTAGTTTSHGPSTVGASTSESSVTDEGGDDSASHQKKDQRYFEVVFVWVKKPEVFAQYMERTGPIVARYGGGAERILSPQQIYAEGLSQPDMVNVVFYNSKDEADAFNRDSDFLQVKPLRAESIEMVSVAGSPVRAGASGSSLEQRLYLLEIAEFGEGGEEAYRDYERKAEQLMGPYGYHVERTLAPDNADGLPFQPDIVKVAYFDSADGLEKFHTHPDHKRLEEELYPAAVKNSVWVTARVHPMALAEAR